MEVFFMAKQGQQFKKYDLDFKKKVLQEYLKGYSSPYLAKKYNIPQKTIESWKKIQSKHGDLDVAKKGKPVGEKAQDYRERYEILKKYQDFLIKQEQKKR